MGDKREKPKESGYETNTTELNGRQVKQARPTRQFGLHAGHRQRMDERFRRDPEFENFALHEMLEYLLYTGVPRKDTNELAHRLIERFGSFSNVFFASIEELTQVSGRLCVQLVQ